MLQQNTPQQNPYLGTPYPRSPMINNLFFIPSIKRCFESAGFILQMNKSANELRTAYEKASHDEITRLNIFIHSKLGIAFLQELILNAIYECL